MKMSDGERLIVVMLAEIMQAMKLSGEIDPTLILNLAYDGDDWAIKRKYHGLFIDETPTKEQVSETTDILWMWGIIEHSLAKLTGREAEEAKGWRSTEFEGFDGNHDDHYGIAQTLIHSLGEFEDFKKRELNSHSQTSLQRYRAMYKKFDIYVRSDNASPLPFDALKDICN